MSQVFLGLGSNMGDKEKNIRDALSLLSEICLIIKQSRLYLTEPVGGVTQDWFLNCAVEVETMLDPAELFVRLKAIERQLGRTTTVKNGPRPIDIDILFYADLILKTKDLDIPHPRIQERLFVLRPLMDLDAEFIHPLQKKSIQEMYHSRPWTQKVLLYK